MGFFDCPVPYNKSQNRLLIQEPSQRVFSGGEVTAIWPCNRWRLQWWNHPTAKWTATDNTQSPISGDKYRNLDTGEIIWVVHFPVGVNQDLFYAECRAAGLFLADDVQYEPMPGEESTPEGPGGENPASKFCVEHGGILEIRDSSDGEYGVCINPENGLECEEWAFYRGECDPFTEIPDPGEVDKGKLPTYVWVVLGSAVVVGALLITQSERFK